MRVRFSHPFIPKSSLRAQRGEAVFGPARTGRCNLVAGGACRQTLQGGLEAAGRRLCEIYRQERKAGMNGGRTGFGSYGGEGSR